MPRRVRRRDHCRGDRRGPVRLTALIHVADRLATRATPGCSRTVDGTEIDPLVLRRLCLTDANVASVPSTQAARVADVLPLSTGDTEEDVKSCVTLSCGLAHMLFTNVTLDHVRLTHYEPISGLVSK